MLLICIIDFLVKYVPIVGYFYLTLLCNVYKVIKSGNEWHAGVDRRGLEWNKTLFLCFSLCMFKFYDRIGKQFLQL